ncbi:glutamyl-tRNA reductase [Halostagnicola larsenii XH-48]|uniref:Glutamyl-tRNA reductase n=1 Tax=Halostagnicola larsenii XH-48 TaxID=797299 RepID=W0JSJ0_9EURY|nr:glutamyl-tRNA reductase [Halostagnicola larsenii]AHG00252.1 glutamyl-tRNA reductase [Halostagnicola larsenii XH-48]
MIPAGVVTGARITHESGTVDDLATASPESQRASVAEFLSVPEVEEAIVLSTCNRVEAYVVTTDSAVGRAALEEFFSETDDDALVRSDHDESLKHLIRVACGLESVVLGEDQIIGQVRTAYEDARTAGGIGPLLEMAVTKAIHVGERARTETKINEGVVSLGSAATRLATDERSLEGETGLVVGAGEMGRLAARNLAETGISELVIANRTVSRATHLIEELDVDGRAVSLQSLETVTERATVIVTATGSDEPLLDQRHLGDREQIVVDLGQPRDVDPAAATLEPVTVFDLDDLETVTERTHGQRAEAASAVETMIEREFDHLRSQYKRARADDVIGTMYESAERIKARELETAISRLEDENRGELTDEQRDIVESMADSLVSQLLAPPTKSLREAAQEDDWRTINTALQLFDPDFGSRGDGDGRGEAPQSLFGAASDPIGATDDD